MSSHEARILVTGAGGQLGGLVVEQLLAVLPAQRITAMVRSAEAAAALAARGVEVRIADYEQPATLDAALAGIERVLLVSSNAIGRRVAQHRNVVDAARRAGVAQLAYTSVLHADRSPLGLAQEHLETERLVRASGLPFVFLRNGWYNENYAGAIAAALAHGTLIGGAGAGRIAAAARADYAAAAVAVLTAPVVPEGQVLELAGDRAFTLAELAAEIGRQAGRPIGYRDLAEADYRAALVAAGLPEPMAALIADSDVGAAKGGLLDESGTLGRLIGRPTTPIAATIAETLARLRA